MSEKTYLKFEKELEEETENGENLDDFELVFRSLKNPKFFEVFVDRYQDTFLRTAGRVLKNKEESEDAVQTAFVKIYFNAGKYKKKEGVVFKSWAFKILLNCVFTRYRKLKRSFNDAEYLDQLLYLTDKKADKVFEIREKRDEIESILKKMPNDLRNLIEEHYLEDKPYVEIADSQKLTISALKMKLFRARKKFKDIATQI